jgi:cellulose synthase operon protein C
MLLACSKAKTVEEYIHDAQDQRKTGRVPAAIINLKNALQQQPKNVTARILLAQSYIDLADGPAAEAELNRAKENGAAPELIVASLAESELLQNKPEQALHDTDLPDIASPEVKANVLAARAKAFMLLDRMDEANDALTAGYKVDSHSLEVVSAMAYYALQKGDQPTALERVAEAQKEHPDDPGVMMLTGSVAIATKDFPTGEKAFTQLVNVQPWNVSARLRLARLQIEQEKFTEANTNLDLVLKSAPNQPNANFFRSLSAFRAKDFDTALMRSQRTLSTAKDFAPALLVAGGSSYALNRLEQADTYLAQYIYLVPGNLRARKMLGAIELKLGHPGDAVKTLTPAVAKLGDDADLLAMIGTAAARSGDLPEADHYLSLAVAKNPDNPQLRAQLGVTQVSLGQTDAGIDELERASKADPSAKGPEIALALTYLRSKEYDKALAIAERLQAAHPDDPAGLDLAGAAYGLKGDEEAAKAAFTKAHELRPGDLMSLANLANYSVRAGKLDEAEKDYQEILRVNPKNGPASVTLAEIQTREGKPEEGMATLRTATQVNPDDPTPRIVLGRLLLSQNKGLEALAVIEPVLSKNAKSAPVLEVAGEAQLAIGKTIEAIASFKSLSDLNPKAGAPHRALASAYASVNNIDGALAEARTAVEYDPKDGQAKALLVRMLIATKSFDEARSVVADLESEYPQNAEAVALEGLIAMNRGRPLEAVAAYKHAMAMADNSLNRSRVIFAQGRAGQLSDAEATAKPWLDQHPDDIEARLALLDAYSFAKNSDGTTTQANEVLKRDPKNLLARIAIARLLIGQKNYADARKIVDEITQTFPHNGEGFELAGMIADAQNRPADAVSAFQQEFSIRDDFNSIRRLTMELGKSGHADDAERTLKPWTLGHPENFLARAMLGDLYLSMNRLEDAKSVYLELSTRTENPLVENNLAWILGTMGQGDDALLHAQRAVKFAPYSADILDTLGTIQMQNHDKLGALQTLQKAAIAAPTNPAIQFHLAQAMVDAGNKDQARTLLRTLMGTPETFKEREQAQKLLDQIGS